MTTQDILTQAAAARRVMAVADTAQKNRALGAMGEALLAHTPQILAANEADLEAARSSIGTVMLDRLALNEGRIQAMAEGMAQVAQLPDPVGRELGRVERPNGLCIRKVSVPMGTVAIIYESRPNGLVDLLIPRGGAGLIQACVENATVPCIQTGTGICHIYVDAAADLEMALNILENAKTSRPSVCNAAEVCLVHREVAAAFLPALEQRLVQARQQAGKEPVALRLCPEAAAIIPGTPAGPKDFDTEFLDYILAVKVVGSLEEALHHIAQHSTGHSDAIVTRDQAAAVAFQQGVDSAAVYVNASTRFTDGGEFGLGCEMGISTQKLHARGPMGLEELCSYQYVILGSGQVR